MRRLSADLALPEARASRRAFDRAAGSFGRASVVHDLTRERLLERLDLVRIAPAVIADLGCAIGGGARALAARYPDARVVAVDVSRAMLEALRAGAAAEHARISLVQADVERLPLANGGVDLIFANMVLPWVRPDRTLAEAARVLAPGGLLLFATLGPDTLEQLRRAWASVDDGVHVHAFFDMHDLGDLAVVAGLREPVMDVDRVELTYRDVDSMVDDLRASGAVNVAAGRRRTLTGRTRWERFRKALGRDSRSGRFGLTFELIFGLAWGRGPAGRRAEAAVPVADIGILRRTER